jgi:hypothetical protein
MTPACSNGCRRPRQRGQRRQGWRRRRFCSRRGPTSQPRSVPRRDVPRPSRELARVAEARDRARSRASQRPSMSRFAPKHRPCCRPERSGMPLMQLARVSGIAIPSTALRQEAHTVLRWMTAKVVFMKSRSGVHPAKLGAGACRARALSRRALGLATARRHLRICQITTAPRHRQAPLVDHRFHLPRRTAIRAGSRARPRQRGESEGKQEAATCCLPGFTTRGGLQEPPPQAEDDLTADGTGSREAPTTARADRGEKIASVFRRPPSLARQAAPTTSRLSWVEGTMKNARADGICTTPPPRTGLQMRLTLSPRMSVSESPRRAQGAASASRCRKSRRCKLRPARWGFFSHGERDGLNAVLPGQARCSGRRRRGGRAPERSSATR